MSEHPAARKNDHPPTIMAKNGKEDRTRSELDRIMNSQNKGENTVQGM